MQKSKSESHTSNLLYPLNNGRQNVEPHFFLHEQQVSQPTVPRRTWAQQGNISGDSFQTWGSPKTTYFPDTYER